MPQIERGLPGSQIGGGLTVETLSALLLKQGYDCPRDAAVVLYLACRMGRPVLVEGPAGVGKTELAKSFAAAMGFDLIRLQCYEGLDESRALYEWEYGKQLLYTQLLREHASQAVSGAATLSEAVRMLSPRETGFFTMDFLAPRPLLQAILSPDPTVLLIDEIDRADPEFEAFLLEVLGDFQVSIPELGTIRAVRRPVAILTSNAVRTLSDALKRRCLYVFMDYPDPERERRIVVGKVPGLHAQLADQVVRFVSKVRGLDLKKAPSVGETLDWAWSLVCLNHKALSREVLEQTVGALLKDRDDTETVLREWGRLR